MNAVNEEKVLKESNEKDKGLLNDSGIHSFDSISSSQFEGQCEDKHLSNFEKYLTISYVFIIIFLCIFFSFNEGAKQTILRPLKEIKEFNVQWFFILMGIGTLLVSVGFPMTILELSVASAIGSFWPAFLLCYITKVTGSLFSFFMGRIFLKERLKVLLCRNQIYKTLIFAVKLTPLKFAILFKFLPIPHIIKSYALAITTLWWVYFLIASMIAAGVYATVWVYLGTTLRDMYDEAEKNGKVSMDNKFVYARFGFIILSFSVTIYLVYYSKCIFDELEKQRKEEKRKRKRLEEEIPEEMKYGTFLE